MDTKKEIQHLNFIKMIKEIAGVHIYKIT